MTGKRAFVRRFLRFRFPNVRRSAVFWSACLLILLAERGNILLRQLTLDCRYALRLQRTFPLPFATTFNRETHRFAISELTKRFRLHSCMRIITHLIGFSRLNHQITSGPHFGS